MGGCCDKENAELNLKRLTRDGEQAAGWLFKTGKKGERWHKRFFVLKDTLLLCYTDEMRGTLKGSMRLFNSDVKPITMDAIGKQHFPFQITHPYFGSRQFYTTSSELRTRWMITIQDQIGRLQTKGIKEGWLSRRGGLGGKQWQERYCILYKKQLECFESADDENPGVLYLEGSKIKEMSMPDKQYCFEILARNEAGKVAKKTFATQTFMDRKKWLDELKNQATRTDGLLEIEDQVSPEQSPASPSPEKSPHGFSNTQTQLLTFTKPDTAKQSLLKAAEGEDMAEQKANTHAEGATEVKTTSFFGFLSSKVRSAAAKVVEAVTLEPQKPQKPPTKSGFMQKKSNGVIKPWRQRYFVLDEDGRLSYYTNREDVNKVDPSGQLNLSELIEPPSASPKIAAGIDLKLVDRTLHLQCATFQESMEWIELMNLWIQYLKTNTTPNSTP